MWRMTKIMQVKKPCSSCKNDRVLAAMDNEGIYVVCKGCLRTREDISKEEREQLINIINPILSNK